MKTANRKIETAKIEITYRQAIVDDVDGKTFPDYYVADVVNTPKGHVIYASGQNEDEAVNFVARFVQGNRRFSKTAKMEVVKRNGYMSS